MKFVERLKEARDVLLGRKGLEEVNAILTMLYGSGSKNVRGWQYKASKLLAEEIGAMELQLFKVKSDGSWEQTFQHDLLELLSKPNDQMIGPELLEQTSMSLDFHGNAYWLVRKDGKTRVIHPLIASRVTIKRSEGFPQRVLYYEYSENSRVYRFNPEEIIHFRESYNGDTLEGLGPFQAIAESLDLDKASAEWNRAFFENAARPDLVLKTKFTTKQQVEILRAQFEDRFKGVKNAHKVAVLPSGVEAEKMSWNQKDMDFMEQQRWNRDDILSGLRTPHVVLGLGAGENLNRATAEATNYIYALRTVRPRMKRIVRYLNEYLVPLFGDTLVLDFVDPVPENEELAIKKRQAALASAPYQSVNEVRDEIGLTPIDGGDSVMAPFSLSPLGDAKNEKRVEPRKVEYRAWSRAKKISEKENKLEQALVKVAEKIAPKVKEIKEKDEGEAQWKSFVSRVTPYEERVKKKIADYSDEMAKRAEGKVEDALKKAVDPKDLLDPDAEMKIIISLLEPVMRDLADSESVEAASLIGASKPDPAKLKKLVEEAVELMAKSYTDTSLDLLKTQLEQGIEAGEGIPDLKRRVRQIGEFSSNVRAETVARTESYRIANRAAREAWDGTAIEKVIWYTALDERVCEFCAPMHERVVGIKDTFFEKGGEVTGHDGGKLKVDYSDVYGGPLHPNCRCQVRPYVES